MSEQQQQNAAAALLRTAAAPAEELGRIFARQGHELALVGGLVRDVFLGRPYRGPDLDLATDAPPEQVLELAKGWADKVWEVGIEFGTVGLRKGPWIFEITTYRSESYVPDSRKPDVQYGTSLLADLARRDFTVNDRRSVAHAARRAVRRATGLFGGARAARGDAGAGSPAGCRFSRTNKR